MMAGYDCAWIDFNHKGYKLTEIDNFYLQNIIKFIERGRGYVDFLSKEKIHNLVYEAKRRGLIVLLTEDEIYTKIQNRVLPIEWVKKSRNNILFTDLWSLL